MLLFFVVPDALDPPTFGDIDSRSLRVNWNKPNKPNGIILHYVLYRNNTNVTMVNKNKTSLRVTDLEPFTIYVFSIEVCTVIGCNKSELSRPVRTLEDGKYYN